MTEIDCARQRVRVCGVSDLPTDDEPVAVKCGDEEIAICNVDGVYFAVQEHCTHERASLAENGWVEGETLVCGWHGARFHVPTGAVELAPARAPLRTFRLAIEADDVFVDP